MLALVASASMPVARRLWPQLPGVRRYMHFRRERGFRFGARSGSPFAPIHSWKLQSTAVPARRITWRAESGVRARPLAIESRGQVVITIGVPLACLFGREISRLCSGSTPLSVQWESQLRHIRGSAGRGSLIECTPYRAQRKQSGGNFNHSLEPQCSAP